MTLAFPNTARSFDDVRKAVRFFGYDGMFEIRFLSRPKRSPRAGDKP